MSVDTLVVVTIVRGRHRHLRLQRRALAAGSALPARHVVVSMGDPVVESWEDLLEPQADVVTVPVGDGEPLPLARARNVGIERAWATGADRVVLLDVDCVPGPELVSGYADALERRPDAVLCGPVAYLPPPADGGGYRLEDVPHLAEPHPARPAPAPGELVEDSARHELFWSLSFAVTRDLWTRVGGFDEGYSGYGGEDTDVGFRLRSLGIPLVWVGSARAAHQHHPVSDPPVEHVDDVLRNGARFREKWGTWPMQGWLEAFADRGLVHRTDDAGYVRAG